MNLRLAVVGGGIIGTALALAAVDRGHSVVQFDRHVEPRGASIRNFGLIWILGRATGRELDLALRGRELWQRIGERAPQIHFRASGALVVAQDAAEMALLEEFVREGRAAARGARLLDADETRHVEPAVGGQLLGSLYGSLDAQIEPEAVLPRLRELADRSGRYSFQGGLAVRPVESELGGVKDVAGGFHACDVIFVCTGRDLDLVAERRPAESGVRVRTLQMLEAGPVGRAPTRSVLDGGGLRYYPAFDLPGRAWLPASDPIAAEFAAQLLVTPRASGCVTLGDTHVDNAPDAFALDERPYAYLIQRYESVFGQRLGPIRRRWMGQYLRLVDGSATYLCERIGDHVVLLTAAGGMGLTAAPSIAAEVLDDLGL